MVVFFVFGVRCDGLRRIFLVRCAGSELWDGRSFLVGICAHVLGRSVCCVRVFFGVLLVGRDVVRWW